MKIPAFLLFLLAMTSIKVTAQVVSAVTIPVNVHDERRNVARATVTLRESYESVFWSLYDQYEHQLPAGVAGMEALLDEMDSKRYDEAATVMKTILENQYREVAVRKEFMERFNRSMNGQVALQFLQSEVLHDLIKSSRKVEEMSTALPQWNTSMLRDEKIKHAVMVFTLGLSGDDETRFLSVYEDYDFDYSRVVGHQLVWFEQYIEDVSELTPAQSLKLAREFVVMQANELKVKEKYFKKIGEEFDLSTAVRFLQAEEYFDMMAKLKVWADLQRDDSR